MKINIAHTGKIESALGRVQRGASARLQAVVDVRGLALGAELRLESLGIPKTIRAGALCSAYEAGLPGSYAHGASTTRVELVRGSTDWFVINISRIGIWPNEASKRSLRLHSEQRDYLAAKLEKPFVF